MSTRPHYRQGDPIDPQFGDPTDKENSQDTYTGRTPETQTETSPDTQTRRSLRPWVPVLDGVPPPGPGVSSDTSLVPTGPREAPRVATSASTSRGRRHSPSRGVSGGPVGSTTTTRPLSLLRPSPCDSGERRDRGRRTGGRQLRGPPETRPSALWTRTVCGIDVAD